MKTKTNFIATDRLEFERDLWSRTFSLIAVVDEFERGPLAGPVVAVGILACRRVGLPSPAAKPHEQPDALNTSQATVPTHIFPGGKDARPLRQAEMPDATIPTLN